MNKIEPENLVYINSYCAFIDVLGFSEFISNTTTPKAIFDVLNKIIPNPTPLIALIGSQHVNQNLTLG
jgi:hypothetical protein